MRMLAPVVLVLAAMAGATGARASEATSDRWQQLQTALDRADVCAEAALAVRAGTIEFGEAGRIAQPPADGMAARTRSRVEVRAEARQALLDHRLGYGELTRF